MGRDGTGWDGMGWDGWDGMQNTFPNAKIIGIGKLVFTEENGKF